MYCVANFPFATEKTKILNIDSYCTWFSFPSKHTRLAIKIFYRSMSATMFPSAEWISASARQAARPGVARSSLQPGDNSSSLDSNAQGQPVSPATARAPVEEATAARANGAEPGNDGHERDTVRGHRGSGGLVTGKAVFCLPPNVEWFQGHFAYAARGGCTASLGVLGTELPVDPCMRCCFGGFSRFKLVFIHYESGKESTLVVERFGGNMMSLHAEAYGRDEGEPADEPNSELVFQTQVMKTDDDARELLDRYFQSVVRAASGPEELRECIVCIGQMDVPLSLLQELAAPLPDGARTQSIVCSAFVPCREAPQHQLRAPQANTNEPTPELSPCPGRRRLSTVTRRDREENERCLGGGGGNVASAPRDRVGGGDQVGPRGESDGDPDCRGMAERDIGETERRGGDDDNDGWF